MNKWVKFNEIGQFYIEQILAELDIPIFFICKDENNSRYACLTIDEGDGQYIVEKINVPDLIAVLENNLTLYDFFKNKNNDYLYLTKYDFESDIMNYNTIKITDISDEYLPTKGEYFDLMDEELRKYLSFLKSSNIPTTDQQYFQSQKKYTIESELTNALMRFSFGRLTVEEAKKKAEIAAKNWDSSNEILAHKGLNWYAKQIVAKL